MQGPEVPLRTKVLYGIGEVGIAAKNTTLNQFLLFFYADVMRVSPAMVSAAIFAAKLWDAVTDPVMGYLSDMTRSRWGRRRPYVVLSAVPVGLAFFLLFTPPASAGSLGLFAYLLVVYMAVNTAFTAYATPYGAWGAELASDYHERTSVVQIRSLCGVVGGVLGATAPVAIANRCANPRVGFSAMAAVLGFVMMAAALATGVGVTERRRAQATTPSLRHFVAGLRQTFANRDFRVVFTTVCLMAAAASLGQAVQLLVIKYRLGLYEFFPVIALTFALSFAGSFPLWLHLSRAIGKRRAMLAGLVLGCIAPLGWLLVQPGQRWAMLIFMVVGGGVSGSMTLAMSSAIDVIDFDELATGERREGAYFGIWTLGLKTTSALGILLGGGLLHLVGYVPDQQQSPDTMWWLVMMVGPLQAMVHVVGLFVFRRFRYEVTDVQRAQLTLAERRRMGGAPHDASGSRIRSER